MILVDVNLLVAGVMRDGRDHEATRAWLQGAIGGRERVGLPWASLLGFVRVVGQSNAWERHLEPRGALSVVRSWLARPNVWTPEPGERHLDILETLLAATPFARLTPDAHLAALAVEHGLEVNSRDTDFAGWANHGVRWRDPLA